MTTILISLPTSEAENECVISRKNISLESAAVDPGITWRLPEHESACAIFRSKGRRETER
jgi:hypothetical protein